MQATRRPSEGEQRPYAAPSNIIAVINRARTRNLPELVSNDFLRIAGIPEAVYGRVTSALRFLNLVHEDGRPSDEFRALARAQESEYKEQLAGIVRRAYQTDFADVDPEKDNQGQISDVFRRYEPRSQTDRMVMLFLGLCREAGIPVLDAPRQRKQMAEGRRKSTVSHNRGLNRKDTSTSTPPPPSNILFGVTEEDISALDEAVFNEVWTALGKVARTRARARAQQAAWTAEEPSNGTEEEQANEA